MACRLPLLFVLVVAVAVAGCTPSVAPLYRDYAIASSAAADEAAALRERIRAALVEAGWTPAEAVVPEAIATAPRTVSDLGLYRTEVSIDVVPVGGRHVRVFFHPYRRYLTGGRSKVPFLSAGLRRALLPPLNEAFARRGLTALDSPRERDEEVANAD
jgi:hypothetical protein